MLSIRLVWLVGILIAGSSSASSPTDKWEADEALAFSQAALGGTVGDYVFTDESGQAVTLESFRGRPLVISLIYTSCFHICPSLTNYLAGMVEIAREALGEDSFTVLSIGFDTPVDTPERMREFARQRGIDMAGWHFLSADDETISALSRDVGFIYFSSPNGFDHLLQTTVVDAQGKVYRQVYGQDFEAPLFVEPLKELVFGRPVAASVLDGWLNSVRLFCTVYDPTSGRYHFDYSIFVSFGVGFLSLGMIAVFIVHAWRNSRPST